MIAWSSYVLCLRRNRSYYLLVDYSQRGCTVRRIPLASTIQILSSPARLTKTQPFDAKSHLRSFTGQDKKEDTKRQLIKKFYIII